MSSEDEKGYPRTRWFGDFLFWGKTLKAFLPSLCLFAGSSLIGLYFVGHFLFRKHRSELLIGTLVLFGFSVGFRYWKAWPLLPLHLGPSTLALMLAAMGILRARKDENITKPVPFLSSSYLLLTCAAVVATLTAFFPKDYYLPFIYSKTIWSHIFFLSGTAGKGFLILSGIEALLTLGRMEPQKKWISSIVWGFTFWTISLFSGIIWSYRGWGVPVVWDDPYTTLAVSVWFYYVMLLHLHLSNLWYIRKRAIFAVVGGGFVLWSSLIADLGPLKLPFGP